MHRFWGLGEIPLNAKAWAGFSLLLLNVVALHRWWGAAPLHGVPVHSKSHGIVLLGAGPSIAPFDREWNSVYRLAMGRRISVNQASASQLETLPHIGPKRAAAIVRYRNENGNFSSLGALVNVRGVGPRTVQRVSPFVEH